MLHKPRQVRLMVIRHTMDDKQGSISGDIGRDKKYHYCVLYVRASKQHKVADAIRETIPEGRGIVFYPCTELWWHGRDNTIVRPLFPCYLFIRSDMNAGELQDLIRKSRREDLSFIRTLNLKTVTSTQSTGESEQDEDGALFDLSEDEAAFLDFMMNFSKSDAADEKRPGLSLLNDRKDIPETGVIRMSRGYRENGNYIVMEGPLKGYEHHIVDVNARNRKAYLDISINGHIAKAGLELWGKRHWFPDDKDAPAMLSDGMEVDLEALSKSMMGFGKESKEKSEDQNDLENERIGWRKYMRAG